MSFRRPGAVDTALQNTRDFYDWAIKPVTSELAHIRQEMGSFNRRMMNMAASLDRLRTEVEETRVYVQEIKDKSAALGADVTALRQQVADLQAAGAGAATDADLDDLSNKLDELNKKVEEVQNTEAPKPAEG